MSKLLVTDELWNAIKHLFPERKGSPKGGLPSKSNRLCLTGILFVLKTGIPWEDFPQEMGCTGMTLWNRLAQWREDGVLETLHLFHCWLISYCHTARRSTFVFKI